MLRVVALLACLLLVPAEAEGLRRLQRRMQHHKQLHHHAKGHQDPLAPQGWSMPPIAKIFRGSEKTASSLEGNMERLKASVNDLRKKDLDDAKEVYAGYVQALTMDDEQDRKLQADNDDAEKKLNALELSNKAEEARRDSLIKENKKLYKQLEELKKTVNSQVNGLEDILKDGVEVKSIDAAPPPQAAVAVQAQPAAAAPAPEYCHCTRPCSDMGWGPWCTVQSANCVTRTPCATGGASSACITVDPRDGPWTRCQNIVNQATPASLLQIASKRQETKTDDEDDDSDDAKDSDAKDDDDDDDEDDDVCQCKTPCHDEGWGMWCYVQSASCRVKAQCEMGGAANACVASDPGGPWTRCSNLLPPPTPKAAQSAALSAPATPQAAVTLPVATQEDITHNTKPVKDVLVKMMTQVDDIRQEDVQSMEKLRELYQQETKRMAATKESILAKKEDLAAKMRDTKDEAAKLSTEVEHLEEVNRSLHTQLRRLEHFLASASTELKGSMDTTDRVAAAAALQTSKSDADDDSDDDENQHKKGHRAKDDDDDDDDEDEQA